LAAHSTAPAGRPFRPRRSIAGRSRNPGLRSISVGTDGRPVRQPERRSSSALSLELSRAPPDRGRYPLGPGDLAELGAMFGCGCVKRTDDIEPAIERGAEPGYVSDAVDRALRRKERLRRDQRQALCIGKARRAIRRAARCDWSCRCRAPSARRSDRRNRWCSRSLFVANNQRHHDSRPDR
jgi:hypothetical protein